MDDSVSIDDREPMRHPSWCDQDRCTARPDGQGSHLTLDAVPPEEDVPSARLREWGRVRTTALITLLAEAVSADDIGATVGAAIELGRRIEAGMIAAEGSGPATKRLQP